MPNIKCKACGRRYSYHNSDLCPHCGAYNRPPHRMRVDFDKDGNIELQIISSSRLDDSDKVEISLNIYNTSDAIVKVTTLNDDAEKPRVTVKGTEGNIIIN